MSAAAAPAREAATGRDTRAPHSAAAPRRTSTRPLDPLAAPAPLPGVALQRCACGAGCPACRAKAAGLSALPIHPADDVYEREADRVADAVMRGGSAPARTTAPALPAISRLQRCSCGGSHSGGGMCPGCAKKQEEMQRSASGSGSVGTAPPIVHDVLRSPGQPLDPASRAFFEPRFGRGFGDVRVHTDARAAESARAVEAVAYTVGRHIVFDAGRYRPGADDGRRLLAHELTHVVQQSGGRGLQRQQAPAASPELVAAPTQTAAAGAATAPLVDHLLALASQVDGARPADNPAAATEVAHFAERLRAVARGNNTAEQIRVLAAFTTPHLARVSQAASRVKAADPHTQIQRVPAGLRTGAIADAAEIEASRLADQVTGGGSVTVRERAGPAVQRQGTAEGMLATLIAFEVAGGAEAEAVSGPPGWVVGGLVLLAIGGLIIVTMARPRVGTCSCQHRDIFTSGGRSCLELRTSGTCSGPYTGVGTDSASCQAAARAGAPAACQGCLGHCLFRSG